jgi:hypothetical protein
MKKLMRLFWLSWLIPSMAGATCVGSLNSWQSQLPMPTIARDAQDGRWQAGGSSDSWDLLCDAFGSRQKVLDTGYYTQWSTNNGESTYGIHAGIPAPLITSAINNLSGGFIPDPLSWISKQSAKWKPLQYANVLLSLDGWAGYRPHLLGDLTSHVPYGFMFRLNVTWTPVQTAEAVAAGL